MKTTIDIADGLLKRAKKKARDEHRTLRDVIEESLRRLLADDDQARKPFRLKDGSVEGNGLQPGIREGDWNQLRDLIYGM